jgi:hypothetical protein
LPATAIIAAGLGKTRRPSSASTPSSKASAVTIRTVADQAQVGRADRLDGLHDETTGPAVTAADPGGLRPDQVAVLASIRCIVKVPGAPVPKKPIDLGESRSERAASAVPISHATTPGAGPSS